MRVRRYRCPTCIRVWRKDLTPVAAPRAKLSRSAVLWALKSLVIDRMSISRIAAGLGAAWHTVNTAILATGQQLLVDDPSRFDGVRVLGVDEHVWRHTPFGSTYVTVIIDLTPIRDKTGPSRLLDIVEGRSKKVFKTWLATRSHGGRVHIEGTAEAGIARSTLTKWVARYRADGPEGLEDRSSAPAARPTRIPLEMLELIDR